MNGGLSVIGDLYKTSVFDPYNDTAIKIESVTDTTITVQVLSVQPSTNTARHTFVSAVPNCISTGGNYTHQFDSVVPGGILKASNTVTIVDNSLTFTCSRDNHRSPHTYPRTTDPASGQTLGVERIANNSFTVNVGTGGGGGRGAIVEARVATNKHKFVSSSAGSFTIGSGGVLTPTNAKYTVGIATPSLSGNVGDIVYDGNSLS